MEIKDMKIYYPTLLGNVQAVDGVSFDINSTESVGLAGESGCGKTTLGMTLLRLTPPPGRIVDGSIKFKGKDLLQVSSSDMQKIRGKQISLVTQAAMNALNPVLKIGDLMTEPMFIHLGLTKSEAWEKAINILGLVGISSDKMTKYPHELSGGMKQRVVIAMSVSLEPDIIILDEPITALDVIIQRQILELLHTLQNKMGLSYLLITHDLATMVEVCEQIVVMYAGKIVEKTDAKTIIEKPLNPYARGLLESVPRLRSKRKSLISIEGLPPSLLNPPSGCRFHPRCRFAKKVCSEREPELREVEAKHFSACHFAEQFL